MLQSQRLENGHTWILELQNLHISCLVGVAGDDPALVGVSGSMETDDGSTAGQVACKNTFDIELCDNVKELVIDILPERSAKVRLLVF